MAKKKYKQPPHVALAFAVLNSEAYKELPYASAKALPLFYAKVKLPILHPNRHYAKFAFSYREGQRHGFESSTFLSIIRNLVHYGFLDPVDKGGLRGAMGEEKTNNIFRLSRRWEKYGYADFETIEWNTFSPQNKSKSTSYLEMYRFKKGNETQEKSAEGQEVISKIEVENHVAEGV